MIETSTAYISLHDGDVLRIEYKADCYIDVKEYDENRQAYRDLMKTEKAYLLTIAGNGAEPSPEVRAIFSTRDRSAFKIAEAFVINSVAHRILANFVMKVQRPAHPIHFFNSESAARNWLYAQRNLSRTQLSGEKIGQGGPGKYSN